jgi:histone deacetylase 6
MDEKSMEAQILELVCYIWDNYLQLYDGIDEIFLMGVGNAYLGVKALLMNRGTVCRTSLRKIDANGTTDCRSRIAGVVNFVNGALRPVKSDVDPDLSSWYKQNSRVYVDRNHACWFNADYTRKVNKKRFGTVVRSEMAGLNKMMRVHAEEVQEWIMERVVEAQHGDTTEEEKMV